MQIWCPSSKRFKRYTNLVNYVKVTRIYSALKLVPIIYPSEFGGTPDIVGTRNCYDADAIPICPQTIFGGGHNYP